MSAQPGYRPAPAVAYAPAPGAPAELRAQLRADRRAQRWVPAFEEQWAAALEELRRSFSLTALYEVVQVWQAPLSSALRSTRSWRRAATSPVSWTWPNYGAGAGEPAPVRGPLFDTGREGPCRTSRARRRGGVGPARCRGGRPGGLWPVGHRLPRRRGRPHRVVRPAVRSTFRPRPASTRGRSPLLGCGARALGATPATSRPSPPSGRA
ncbi:DUF6247 family protein [Streptomyces sp. NPDC101118]|uniref:DUF6247 family protein n=1 Tax=Streptomyces sp. NPDC101118 TaxID=3366109 RepID=UPI003805E8C8